MAVMATSAGSAAEGSGPASKASQSTVPKLDTVSQRLEHIVRYSLDKLQFRNAVFLAERLVSQAQGSGRSEAEREYAQYLLATCHYRQGKPEMAWAVLEGCTSSRSRYLFAQCCLDLRRYVEGAGVLEWLLEDPDLAVCPPTDISTDRDKSDPAEPDRASVLNLLGHTSRAQQRPRLAIKYFQEALGLNPFLWEAYEGLCELGAPMDPNTLFAPFDHNTIGLRPRSLSSFQRSRSSALDTSRFITSRHHTMQDDNVESASANASNIFSSTFSRHESGDLSRTKSTFLPSMLTGGTSSMSQSNGSPFVDQDSTENTLAALGASHAIAPQEGSKTVLKRGVGAQARKLMDRSKSSTSLQARPSSAGIGKRGLERSATVSGLGPGARATKSRGAHKLTSTLGIKRDAASIEQDRDQLRDMAAPMIPSSLGEAELAEDEESLRTVIDIFRILARAYGLLSINSFSESVTEFESLPPEHLQSGWVQSQLGKCKFGMVDYASSARYFGRARELEPNLHRDMEIYSTCLWHLNKETMLSTLAKELKDSNLQSPEAWVALGNAYSKRRDSDQALRCFQRAIQLNDRFPYAHTLCGHEYTDLEEYDKAQTAFRTAMNIDPRHYYAWFGMGIVYDKIGKNDLALLHFKEAYKLNPSGSVVLYRVGMSQEKMNRVSEALRSFEAAIKLDSTNVAARFSKARVQRDLGQYDEALKELEVIMRLSPDEPNVFLLQAKVLIGMGQKEQALKYLTWALNLDSKSSHAIRDMIEKLDQDTDSEERRYEVKVDTEL